MHKTFFPWSFYIKHLFLRCETVAVWLGFGEKQTNKQTNKKQQLRNKGTQTDLNKLCVNFRFSCVSLFCCYSLKDTLKVVGWSYDS